MDIKALQVFGEISTALSRESNVDRILETILLGAKQLTNADGATLYSVENNWLQFALIHSNSLNLDLHDNRTVRACFQRIPLYDEFGNPNTKTVATFCVHSDTTVNIPDAYRAKGFDFSGTKEFDRKTGYASRSFLSVPIKDNTDRAIAVLQLINPKDRDTQAIGSFSVEDQRLVESLATLAAVAFEKHHLTRYKNVLTGSLYVHDSNGELHLSRAHFVALLEACGLAHNTAEGIAVNVLYTLVKKGQTEISLGALISVVGNALETELDKRAAERFRAWIGFKQSGLPLLVLIGGATGTGKSTLAADLALRLDIGRIQSTDTLREVMRLFVSKHMVPELHASSYDAWRSIRCPTGVDPAPGTHLIEGYRAQASKVSLAIDGVLNRSVKERVSTIVEGIHIHPSFHNSLSITDAIVVPVMLVLPDKKELSTRFTRRGEQAPTRRSARYMAHFDAIWQLQAYFINEAERHSVPVIPNIKAEHTVRQVLNIISDTLITRFSLSTPST